MSNNPKHYYSAQNPHGPYGTTQRFPHELAEDSGHTEGFSTARNLKQWADYASKNSGPRVAPGLGKGNHTKEEDRRHVEPSRAGVAKQHR
jgi:hypothetical protein